MFFFVVVFQYHSVHLSFVGIFLVYFQYIILCTLNVLTTSICLLSIYIWSFLLIYLLLPCSFSSSLQTLSGSFHSSLETSHYCVILFQYIYYSFKIYCFDMSTLHLFFDMYGFFFEHMSFLCLFVNTFSLDKSIFCCCLICRFLLINVK